ncbi:hypothetical protein PCCS19_24110 [Paenibacillus sp. CCS19]|nr:hypothetical protein PCCS19_24110 [Paenibacillus cellulosilyticus]
MLVHVRGLMRFRWGSNTLILAFGVLASLGGVLSGERPLLLVHARGMERFRWGSNTLILAFGVLGERLRRAKWGETTPIGSSTGIGEV